MSFACVLLLSLFSEVPASILYGGILNENEVVNSTDKGLDGVVQVAFQHVQKYFPSKIPADDAGTFDLPTVSWARRTRLQYSQDNLTPLFYQEVTPSLNGDRIQRRKAVLGMTFDLTLTWLGSQHRHSFIVTLDRGRIPYLYSHTFSKSETSDCGDSEIPGTCLREPNCPEGQAGGPNEHRGLPMATDEIDNQQPTSKYLNSPLSFVSYNIWNFRTVDTEEMYHARIKRVGKLISESGADILGFQEVRFDFSKRGLQGPSQVDHLREYLPGYQFVFQPAMSFPRDYIGRIEEGLAIFSKHPILNHDYILLSRNTTEEEDRHQRICLHAEIETPWQDHRRVHIFVAHLSLSKPARERNVVEIWEYMKQFSGPVILMGDLNAEPTETPMRFLRGEVDINGTRTQGLKDGWLIFNKEPRPDAPKNYQENEVKDVGLTFSAVDEELRKRIDYIFVRDDPSVNVQSVNILDDSGRESSASSDHLALRAVIGPGDI